MYEDDDRRRRKSPFDAFDEMFEQMGMDPSEFDRLFRDMHRSLAEAMRSHGIEPGKPFVQGFSFKMDSDGRPHFEHFGNRAPHKDPGSGVAMSGEREPLTDVLEGKEEIAVTLEIPGVDKEDIKIDAKPERLEISVDNEHRKYHKIVRLPAKADPTTTKATYKNGVLDITVRKKDQEDDGIRVQVE